MNTVIPQVAFNAQVIGLCHDNELLGNAIITKAKLIHIPSHPKMLIIAVNPSRRFISNKIFGYVLVMIALPNIIS
jgi:hypothetical protein